MYNKSLGPSQFTRDDVTAKKEKKMFKLDLAQREARKLYIINPSSLYTF